MTSLLWILIAIQIVMGVFDTFYHHELTRAARMASLAALRAAAP